MLPLGLDRLCGVIGVIVGDRQTLIKSFKSIFLDFFVFVLCPYICVFVGDDRKISFGSAVSSPCGVVARSGYAVTPDSAPDPVWF